MMAMRNARLHEIREERRMRLHHALLAGSILSIPAAAWAQPISGLYVGAGAGLNLLQTQTIKYIGRDSIGAGTNPQWDAGYAVVASVGWGFGNGFRTEVEINYRSNDLRGFKGLGLATSTGGKEEKYGAVVNVLYDFDLASYGISFMTPYLGLGAGYVQNHWAKVHGNFANGDLLQVNNDASGLAAQAIVGTAFPLTMIAPNLAATLEYRFYTQPYDRKYNGALFTPQGDFTGKLKVADNFNHSIMVGLRWAFEVAPPPPPPAPAPVAAPAPAPSRTYLVFFDWDKADITDRARQIISEAAQNSTRVQYTRIDVAGHADHTGTEAYNLRLSRRRAENVAAELVRDGVPKSAIDISYYGFSRPLVPTAAGVREPQNRRVEIVLK
jgi:outer membrane protein OmpA-like peptidoglycan-associated protein